MADTAVGPLSRKISVFARSADYLKSRQVRRRGEAVAVSNDKRAVGCEAEM
jgi:hypothetical protein